MAAVTQAGYPQRHVWGDQVVRRFQISGATGTTLDTGLVDIQFVFIQQSTAAGSISLITAFAVAGSVITFTTGGSPMVSEVILVLARKG